MAAGAGLAVHSVLSPTDSATRDEPQAQTVPDKDYEGVKRSKGGAFQPADEVREDVWRVQSRSSPEANRLFYGTDDPKVIAKQGGLGSFESLTSDAPTWDELSVKELEARGGVAGAAAANDAEWERRRQRLQLEGRLYGEHPPHPDSPDARYATPPARSLKDEMRDHREKLQRVRGRSATAVVTSAVRSPHTCGERPLDACHACLEANR
jgi:hypothetical protein